MSVDPFLYFDGDCREALEFYAGVFRAEPQGVMTYADAPGAPSDDAGRCPVDGTRADHDRILYASLPIFGVNAMFSDCADGAPYSKGSNIGLAIGTDDADEVRRVFSELAEGGTVQQPLGPQFFGPLFGMLTDRYGVIWMLSLTEGA